MNAIRRISFIIILILTAASGLTEALHAAEKRDTVAERILLEMRRHFNGTSEDSLYRAAASYREHSLSTGNLHNYYKGWQAEILYDINFNHFYRAMKKTVEMSQDMKERKAADELYSATFLFGVIYSLQGNTAMAKDCFQKALKEAGGQKPVNLIQIYKDLANVEMDDEPHAAMADLERAIRIIRAAGLKYEYSDALAFKVIVAFAMRDWQAVKQLSSEYLGLQKTYGDEFSTTYYTYVMMCRETAEGKYREAIGWADRLTNVDKYKFRAKIYEIAGDTAQAYVAQGAYIEAKDSMSSAIMVQELNNAAHDVEMAAMKNRADEARAMKVILTLTLIVAAVTIIALALIIRGRDRYLEKLQQKNNALEVLRDKAEEAERMKASILKNMSHEVRTPLNIISGFAQLMCQPDFNPTPEERDDIAERIAASSDHLVKTTNDLLYVASKESENYTARTDTVSCNEVCRMAIDSCHKVLPKGIALTLDSQLADSFSIKTNAKGMERVLDSLLDNARKFTPEHGAITVECSHDKQNNVVAISVSDTGAPIPADSSEKIFDMFYKIDTNTEGLGIGLSLSRRIARSLGGDLKLDTAYTTGTRFVMTLPA